MKKIVIYAPEDLAALASEATSGTTAQEWLGQVREKIARMVKHQPSIYRSFGPYWWAVKAQLVDAGLLAGEVDADLLAAVTSGDALQDMAGAVAYHGYNTDLMRDTNEFQVDTADGDTVTYLLIDSDFEPH